MPLQLTEQQQMEVREEFARRRRRQVIATVPAVLGAAGAGIVGSAGVPMGGAAQVIVVAVILGVVGFALKNWRCPACDGYLGRTWNPRFCAKCGVELR